MSTLVLWYTAPVYTKILPYLQLIPICFIINGLPDFLFKMINSPSLSHRSFAYFHTHSRNLAWLDKSLYGVEVWKELSRWRFAVYSLSFFIKKYGWQLTLKAQEETGAWPQVPLSELMTPLTNCLDFKCAFQALSLLGYTDHQTPTGLFLFLP